MHKKHFEFCGIGYTYDGLCNTLTSDTPNYKFPIESHLDKKNIPRVCDPDLQYVEQILERFLPSITLQVTQACNLRCTYCPYTENNGTNRKHSPISMNEEGAVEALTFFKKRSVDVDNLSICFYGGEPLIKIDLIKKIVKYATRHFSGKTISFLITTNGTLLNDTICQFMEENNFKMLLSVDGPPSINDRNRKFANSDESVFDKVKKNLARIHDFYPDLYTNTSLNIVMDPQNDYLPLSNFKRNYSEFAPLSCRAAIVELEHSDKQLLYSSEFVTFYQYDVFLALLGHFGLTDRTIYSENILQTTVSGQIESSEDAFSNVYAGDSITVGGPCFAGRHKLFVDVYGRLMPCERLSETSADTIIGSISGGFNIDAIVHITDIAALTEDDCKACWAFRHCGTCIRQCLKEGKLSATQRLSHCADVKRALVYQLCNYLAAKHLEKYVMRGKFLC